MCAHPLLIHCESAVTKVTAALLGLASQEQTKCMTKWKVEGKKGKLGNGTLVVDHSFPKHHFKTASDQLATFQVTCTCSLNQISQVTCT